MYASIRSSSNTSLGKITGGSGRADDDIPLSESQNTTSSGEFNNWAKRINTFFVSNMTVSMCLLAYFNLFHQVKV